jgi:hypothetical protein
MPESPKVGTEDRSKWRYENNGPPLHVAAKFLELLKAPNSTKRLDEIRALVTAESWPIWKASIQAGLPAPFLNELNHVSHKVRYPADGMAYVFCLTTHPDHTESFVVEGPTAALMHPITLLEEAGEWRVHQVGELPSPASLGKVAYSF